MCRAASCGTHPTQKTVLSGNFYFSKSFTVRLDEVEETSVFRHTTAVLLNKSSPPKTEFTYNAVFCCVWCSYRRRRCRQTLYLYRWPKSRQELAPSTTHSSKPPSAPPFAGFSFSQINTNCNNRTDKNNTHFLPFFPLIHPRSILFTTFQLLILFAWGLFSRLLKFRFFFFFFLFLGLGFCSKREEDDASRSRSSSFPRTTAVRHLTGSLTATEGLRFAIVSIFTFFSSLSCFGIRHVIWSMNSASVCAHRVCSIVLRTSVKVGFGLYFS